MELLKELIAQGAITLDDIISYITTLELDDVVDMINKINESK